MTGSLDGKICIWEATTGRLIRKIRAPDVFYSLRFFARGQKLLSAGAGTVRIWDAASLQP